MSEVYAVVSTEHVGREQNPKNLANTCDDDLRRKRVIKLNSLASSKVFSSVTKTGNLRPPFESQIIIRQWALDE